MCTYYDFYFVFKRCNHSSISEQVVYCKEVKEAARKAAEAAQTAEPATRNWQKTERPQRTRQCLEISMRDRERVNFGCCFPGKCHDCTGYTPARWDPFVQWLEDLGDRGVDTRKVLGDIWDGKDPNTVLEKLGETHYHYDKTTPDAGCCVIL